MADSATDHVARFLSSLEIAVRTVAPAEWGITLDAAGFELDIGIAVRGPLLRAQAAVLPAGVIGPHQLLYWNRQAPLVGLLLASATRAREFAIQNA